MQYSKVTRNLDNVNSQPGGDFWHSLLNRGAKEGGVRGVGIPALSKSVP